MKNILDNKDLIEQYCIWTDFDEIKFYHMVDDWNLIDAMMEQFGKMLIQYENTKLSKHMLLLEREYQIIINKQANFEKQYKVKCQHDLRSAIIDYINSLSNF